VPAQVRNATGSNSGSAATTTMTATLPAGVQPGDLLISVAFGALAAAPTARPSASTLVRNIADATSNMDVIRKTAAGGDVLSWTVTSRKWAVTTVAIVAGTWDTANPFIVENGINHTAAAAATYTTPSVNVTEDDGLLIAVFGNRGASTWTVPAQTPPMTEAADTTSSGTNAASCCLTHSALNAVPTGTISRQATATTSQADACMWIAVIRPSATGGPIPRFRGAVGQRYVRRAVTRSTRW
jgi:hypothetical protein